MLHEAEFTIIGTGMVGLATAIDLLQQNKKVCLIGKPAPELPNPANRVVALHLAAKNFLQALKVWDKLSPQDCTPYNKMQIWEKDQSGNLVFTAEDGGVEQLGYIVINSALEQALWERIKEFAGQYEYFEDTVVNYNSISKRHFITTSQQNQVISTFMVICDGANSFMRQALHIGVDRNEYQQTALTCVIELPEEHQHTCYQSFHKNGILAYLPLANEKQVSIVWSVNSDIVEQVLAYPDEVFCQEMYACFHKGLGVPKLISEVTSFPLAKQYAQKVIGDNYVLLGDAAHTIHPLAGQGVNLGFADVWQFCDLIRNSYQDAIGIEPAKLESYARKRKAHAVMVSESMAAIKNIFINDNPLLTQIRNLGLNLVNNSGFIKSKLIKEALGFGVEQFSQASYDQATNLQQKKENAQQLVKLVDSTLQQTPLKDLAQELKNKLFK